MRLFLASSIRVFVMLAAGAGLRVEEVNVRGVGDLYRLVDRRADRRTGLGDASARVRV